MGLTIFKSERNPAPVTMGSPSYRSLVGFPSTSSRIPVPRRRYTPVKNSNTSNAIVALDEPTTKAGQAAYPLEQYQEELKARKKKWTLIDSPNPTNNRARELSDDAWKAIGKKIWKDYCESTSDHLERQFATPPTTPKSAHIGTDDYQAEREPSLERIWQVSTWMSKATNWKMMQFLSSLGEDTNRWEGRKNGEIAQYCHDLQVKYRENLEAERQRGVEAVTMRAVAVDDGAAGSYKRKCRNQDKENGDEAEDEIEDRLAKRSKKTDTNQRETIERPEQDLGDQATSLGLSEKSA
ncbi:hypothetical protein BDV96DRAFT_640988 [Lophiotrema nucula]|uniref:Uncharacterized protein n=1 Tax=Lophiotrema nucula TaxID=690887 RepID=A0A6A5ZRW0_9PLEO|nr:hypothetical protein BDV96DRAFT_640988 [Lophiotrema nucula]